MEAVSEAAPPVIGLDTNVLVRYLVEDDRAQTDSVHRLLSEARNDGETVYVSLIVLCETYWVLRSVFCLPRTEILAAFRSLLAVDVFQFEEPDAVRQALESCGKSKGDFADHLIGRVNAARGCRHTATFDRSLKSAPGSSVL